MEQQVSQEEKIKEMIHSLELGKQKELWRLKTLSNQSSNEPVASLKILELQAEQIRFLYDNRIAELQDQLKIVRSGRSTDIHYSCEQKPTQKEDKAMNKESNLVTIYDGDVARVSKFDADITKGKEVFIVRNNREVYIVGMCDTGNPDKSGVTVLLYKTLHSRDEAYKKWCYLIGKMSRKTKDSKYFEGRKPSMHFNNGDVGSLSDANQRVIMGYITTRLGDVLDSVLDTGAKED